MDSLHRIPVTLCFSKAGASAGTTSTISTSATINFVIRGRWGTAKTAITNGATPTTDWATGLAFIALPAATASIWNGCTYVLGLDHSGNLKVVQGTIVQMDVAFTTSSVAAFLQAPQFGALPLDFCPFAYLVVYQYAATSATFLFGTTSNSLANTSFTFVDCCMLPDRPQIN